MAEHNDFLNFLGMQAAQRAETDVEIYLLIGQSNADGYSSFASAKPGTRDGNYYENVRYCGRRRNMDGSCVYLYDHFGAVHEGLGHVAGCIGPELGMARYMDGLYADTNRRALICKVAAGGTSLTRHLPCNEALYSPESMDRFRRFGSWYPHSALTEENRQADPDGCAGFLERDMMDFTEQMYARLQALHFRSVRFKAICWMQGEDDIRHGPEENYDGILEILMREIREHLTKVSGCDCSTIPVVIGEISETFRGGDEERLRINEAFLTVQHRAAERIPGGCIAPIRGFHITELGPDGESYSVGTDLAHWGYTDMLRIGEVFGETAYRTSHPSEQD